MRVAGLLAALIALMPASTARATDGGERLGRFTELARHYAAETDPAASAALLAELFGLMDVEVVDNLRSGAPFASAAFIQERMETFSESWGGTTFLTVQPEPGRVDTITMLLVTVTRAEAHGSLRIYGRAGGDASLLATSLRDGAPALHAWPRGREGATQFLVSWVGAPTGRGSRSLRLELWRVGAPTDVRRVWSSDEPYPQGLWAIGFGVARGQVTIRHEVRYPGWTPGCAGQTEEEAVYRQPRASETLALLRHRVWNGWHRELRAAVTRFFAALGANDARTLADLVPKRSVRARLPRGLEPEPGCDERAPDRAGTVSVAATSRGPGPPLSPWSLVWQREPRGWRLAGANPVLE